MEFIQNTIKEEVTSLGIKTNAGFNQAGTAVQDLQKVQQGLKLGGNKNIVNKVSDINIKMNNNTGDFYGRCRCFGRTTR